MLLIAGGDVDPNLTRLRDRATARRLPHRTVLAGAASDPDFAWQLGAPGLTMAGEALQPTALFLRYDVFAHLADGRLESRNRAGRWYTALLGWALAHRDVALLNRGYGTRQSSKPATLLAAAACGLAIPETHVTTAPPVDNRSAWIVKPVNGGEHTRGLDELPDAATGVAPMFVQRRLVGPELRIYRVGAHWFGFLLRSPALDYRTDPRVEVAAIAAPRDLTGPLGALMDAQGLDFGAADFKTCPDTGRFLFLEVNSAPMFAAFDRVARGAVVDAILDRLSPADAVS